MIRISSVFSVAVLNSLLFPIGASATGDWLTGREHAEQKLCTGKTAKSGPVAEFVFGRVMSSSRSDTVSESGPDAVLGLRTLDIDRNSRTLVVDSRSRRVTIRDSNLRNTRLLGGKGEGPGEYRIPTFAAFGTDGSTMVLDSGLGRLSVFNATGQFDRVWPGLPVNTRQVLPVDENAILALGAVARKDEYDIATLLNRNGKVLWQGVPADPVLGAIGLLVDAVLGARSRDGSVLVGVSISPTIRRVAVRTGQVLCSALVPKEYWRQLDPSKRPTSGGLAPLREWVQQSSKLEAIQELQDGRLLIAIARTHGDESTKSDWIVLNSDLSPSVHVGEVPGRLLLIRGDTVWLTGAADDGRVTLVRGTLKIPVVR